MSLPAVACAAVEVALNRYLRREDAALRECAQLQGRTVQLVLAGDWSLTLEFLPTGVRVFSEMHGVPDVRVGGNFTALVQALRHAARGVDALPAGLSVEGDTELLMRFRGILQRVGFDPEEWLAPLLGGVAAHRLVDGLKRALSWTQRNAGRMADHGAEYLREETYDLARARDVDQWMNQVEDTREALDRLEARLRRLEAGPGLPNAKP